MRPNRRDGGREGRGGPGGRGVAGDSAVPGDAGDAGEVGHAPEAREARGFSRRLRERRLRQLQWLAHMERWEDWPHGDGAPPHAGGFDPRTMDPRMHYRSWRWKMRARHRWHQRWHRHHAEFKHSLGARLIAIFIVLAVLSSLVVWGAISHAFGLILAVPLLLLLTGLAYGGIRHMVRPLSALAVGAEAFGRGELDHRVPVFHRDEIGDLAMRFNQMAADIQAMLDGKRALLLAISHELRSPLTRARLHAELVEEGASKESLLDELGQMRDLISALLESERLGSGHAALQLAPCDLATLVRALAQPGVTLDIQPDLPPVSADRMRIQLLLRNLVHNALRHNEPAQGPVVVSLRADGQGSGAVPGGMPDARAAGLRLTVRDHGPGVPPEALSQLGQPFFRPDEARTRAEGGVGLGLSLCRLVAEAHGSRLVLRNAAPGFEASVVLRPMRDEIT
ncbi:Signal transduction histidine kinase [Roseateles sp. YR242]|uniref:sensor histidine kinase n=1 Tax=Roseateles sp. YR242 TaxID=1855305 RepID=UPI0008D4266E|nr:HAMP domain-containing sensor histidine kinase [Roseateles sp. YR242]SEL67300.1 Signal transduction histidine kinase [Roseateles sp. YR242]